MLCNVLKLQHKPRKGIYKLPLKSLIWNSGRVNKMNWEWSKVSFFPSVLCFPGRFPPGLCSYAISCLRESEGCWIYMNLTLWHHGNIYAEHKNTHVSNRNVSNLYQLSKKLLLRIFIYRETTPVWQRMWGDSDLVRGEVLILSSSFELLA